MEHNYNDTPLLTSSDYETIMEDLKPHNFSDFGSPYQNIPYEDTIVPDTRGIPPPPPLQEFGPVQFQGVEEPQLLTSPPELSPSLSPTGTIPSRDEYPGQLEFEIQLDSSTSSKKSWLYSHQLKKVFIDMNKKLLIQFRVNQFMNGLFVRALPVYEQDNFVSVPVTRCGIHALPDDPHFKAHNEPTVCNCARHKLVRHVVLSSHSQARYDYNGESDRHSVVVPLDIPHLGSDTTTIEYYFTCKTSCPHGMNRKPIVVIFTLENMQCEVLGRLILPVKICSCPKRDKEKEEKEKEEGGDLNTPKPGKRRLSAQEKESKRLKTENLKNEPKEDEGNVKIEEKSLEAMIDKRFTQLEQRMDQLEAKIEVKFDLLLNAISQLGKPGFM